MAIGRYCYAVRYGGMTRSVTIGNALKKDQELLRIAAVPADSNEGGHDPLTRCEACFQHFQVACERLDLVPRVTPGCVLFAEQPTTKSEKCTRKQREVLRNWRRNNIKQQINQPGCPGCCKCPRCKARGGQQNNHADHRDGLADAHRLTAKAKEAEDTQSAARRTLPHDRTRPLLRFASPAHLASTAQPWDGDR